MTKLDVARKLQHVVELLDRSPAADGRSQDAALYLRAAIALLVSEEESHADGVERLPSAPPIAQHDLVSLALDPGLPGSGSAPGFDPVKMSLDLIRLVNGPGGTVEQTYLYLDRQSAADWLSICSTESFAESYRKTRPLAAVAADIAQRLGAMPLDVNALGPGDGTSEVALGARFYND